MRPVSAGHHVECNRAFHLSMYSRSAETARKTATTSRESSTPCIQSATKVPSCRGHGTEV
eukprot:2869013-Rhodomonas_salina.1